MINLYVMNVSPFEDRSLFSKGLSLIDEERQNKVNMLKHEGAKKSSLGAGLLLLYGLHHFSESMETGAKEPISYEITAQEMLDSWTQVVASNQISYTYGPHGKPYVDGQRSIYFSLSHSGDYVLLAISEEEIGADIQLRKDVDFSKIGKHFMTQQEYETWVNQDKDLQKELFYQIWAGKEAYLKLTGEGMTAGFQTVWLDVEKATIVDSRNAEQVVTTYWYEMDDYQLAICQFT